MNFSRMDFFQSVLIVMIAIQVDLIVYAIDFTVTKILMCKFSDIQYKCTESYMAVSRTRILALRVLNYS
jgi:hypothetical protein